jgi:ribosome-associated protein
MPKMTPAQLTKLAVDALEDLKGVNIELIDVAPLTTIADHMVICTGTSNRHVKALADSVLEKANEAGVRAVNAQGLEAGEWALVDLNGTLVHVMQAAARATYQLEKLWDLGQPKPRLESPKPAKAKPGKKAKPATKAKPAAKGQGLTKKSPVASKAKPMKTKPAVGKKPAAKKPLAKKPVKKKAAVSKAVTPKPTAKKKAR